VHVLNSTFADFRGSNGAGIWFQPANAGAKLFVSNSYFSENGVSGAGGGIVIQPQATGSAKVAITNSRFNNNVNFGISVDTTGNTGAGIQLTVDGVDVSGNGAGIGINNPASTTSVKGTIVNSTVTSNGAFGILSNGPNSLLRVGNTTIANNGSFGVLAVGAGTNMGIYTFTPATNKLVDNGNNGTFSGSVAQQ
jgi:hypothetical protein